METNNQVMTMNTKDFGEIKYHSDQVYRFEEGLIGLEDLKDFVMLYYSEKYYVMHSLQRDDLYFVLTEPGLWDIKMSISLTEEDLEKLETTSADDIAIMLMANIDQTDAKKSSLIFKAPLILNLSAGKAMQKLIKIEENTLDFILDEEKEMHMSQEKTKLPIDSTQ